MMECGAASHLVDGRYGIVDLLDLEELRDVFDKFTMATGFTIGFLDHPGLNVLIATGWRDICTKFHRSKPASAQYCLSSNRHLLDSLTEPGQVVIEACENGLVDCATPIIVKGTHIASLATGQLLLEPPDMDFFRHRAELFGFDEGAYLAAVEDVPVVSRETLRDVTIFLGRFALMISEMGYTQLIVREKSGRLEKEVAERKSAEQEIQILNRELETRVQSRTMELQDANRELEAFCYSVSHDLRAPLRAIDGFSQILLEDYGTILDADGRGALRRVRMAAERMGHLIDDILSLSRLTRQDLRPDDVDLSALADEVLDELERQNPDRRVHRVVEPSIVVRGDGALLRSVLENLLGNAFKFTAKTDAALVEFGTRHDDGREWYFVRDNGAGFDMAHADMLFAAFGRLHSEEAFQGTGIGLATVKRAIARHGGEVAATGAVDEGATFSFTLPDGLDGGGEAAWTAGATES